MLEPCINEWVYIFERDKNNVPKRIYWSTFNIRRVGIILGKKDGDKGKHYEVMNRYGGTIEGWDDDVVEIHQFMKFMEKDIKYLVSNKKIDKGKIINICDAMNMILTALENERRVQKMIQSYIEGVE